MSGAAPGINIQPGELYLARRPAILRTILGSCVGVTFWNPRLGIGALCHGVLPRSPRGAALPDAWRYVDFSIRYLLNQFYALGSTRSELEVKLFGGADVLPTAVSNTAATVGAQNCRAALDTLEGEGLRAVASDLGGVRGRTIRFDTATGEVYVHRLAALGAPESAGGGRSR